MNEVVIDSAAPAAVLRELPSVVLDPEELQQLTGYRRPTEQLAELHRQGFYRARRAPSDGSVILERHHYAAVCSGSTQTAPQPKVRPSVREKHEA